MNCVGAHPPDSANAALHGGATLPVSTSEPTLVAPAGAAAAELFLLHSFSSSQVLGHGCGRCSPCWRSVECTGCCEPLRGALLFLGGKGVLDLHVHEQILVSPSAPTPWWVWKGAHKHNSHPLGSISTLLEKGGRSFCAHVNLPQHEK